MYREVFLEKTDLLEKSGYTSPPSCFRKLNSENFIALLS